MGNGVSNGIRRAAGALTAAFFFAGLGVSLSGCPVAAELENRDRFQAFAPGSVACNQLLPDGPSVIGCDYKATLGAHCTKGGCHNNPSPPGTPASQLNLIADDLLIARILEVPSKHIITCSLMGTCNLEMPQCDGCRECMDDKLLTKADIPNSWLIRKMAEFDVTMPNTTQNIGCGMAMPIAPWNTGFDEEKRTCLTNFFTWIANNGRACDISAGGSGGGGSGGAGASGAGSGGTGGT